MAGETRGNGESGALPPPADGPQMFVNVQYIKDLSFENPRAPQSLIQPATQPEVAINVDVKARNLNPGSYEVVLTINVNANAQGEPVFLVELAYAAVVTVVNAHGVDDCRSGPGRDAANHLSVCAGDRRQCDARRRVSAAIDQPDRLCRAVAPTAIAWSDGGTGRSARLKLRLLKLRRRHATMGR